MVFSHGNNIIHNYSDASSNLPLNHAWNNPLQSEQNISKSFHLLVAFLRALYSLAISFVIRRLFPFIFTTKRRTWTYHLEASPTLICFLQILLVDFASLPSLTYEYINNKWDRFFQSGRFFVVKM